MTFEEMLQLGGAAQYNTEVNLSIEYPLFDDVIVALAPEGLRYPVVGDLLILEALGGLITGNPVIEPKGIPVNLCEDTFYLTHLAVVESETSPRPPQISGIVLKEDFARWKEEHKALKMPDFAFDEVHGYVQDREIIGATYYSIDELHHIKRTLDLEWPPIFQAIVDCLESLTKGFSPEARLVCWFD